MMRRILRHMPPRIALQQRVERFLRRVGLLRHLVLGQRMLARRQHVGNVLRRRLHQLQLAIDERENLGRIQKPKWWSLDHPITRKTPWQILAHSLPKKTAPPTGQASTLHGLQLTFHYALWQPPIQ